MEESCSPQEGCQGQNGLVLKAESHLAKCRKNAGDEFGVADGQLTASMKMWRRAVKERYREQIEALFAAHGS